MKKIAALLILACSAFALTAGGSQEEGGEPEVFSLLMFTDWYKAGWEVVDPYLEERALENGFDLDVELIPGSEQGVEIMKLRFASGEYPDFLEYGLQDAVRDLGGIEQFIPLEGDWTANFTPSIMESEQFSVEGKTYALPIDPLVLTGVFYNKKVFEKAGVQVPRTWEELVAAAETIRAAGIDPFFFAGKDVWTLTMVLNEGFIREYGRVPMEEFYQRLNRGELKYADLPLLKDALLRSKELVDRGLVQENFVSDTYDRQQEALAKGEAAMIFQGSWVVDEIANKWPEAVDDLGAFALPFEDEGYSSVFMPFPFLMTRGNRNPEKAQELVAYLASDEIQGMFAAAQPGLWAHKKASPEVFPAVADLKAWLDTGRVAPWYGLSTKYQMAGIFAENLQGFYLGLSSVEQVLQAADEETRKQAVAKNDPHWR